jgi:hypothetical protein
LRKGAIGLPEGISRHVLDDNPLAGESNLAARWVRRPDLEPIDGTRIKVGHPRGSTETQPRAIWIDNVQSNPGVTADLLSGLLSHRTEHHTYRSPADCQLERLFLSGQSALASAQRFVHALFRVDTADYHGSEWGLVPGGSVRSGHRYRRVDRNQRGGD